jgi:phage shock protein PspC (stress-responsive transcriptional regulator)
MALTAVCVWVVYDNQFFLALIGVIGCVATIYILLVFTIESRKYSHSSSSNQEQQFFRITEDRRVAGVCTGLGEYFAIEVVWVRLFFMALTAAYGCGAVIYILLACRMENRQLSSRGVHLMQRQNIANAAAAKHDAIDRRDETGRYAPRAGDQMYAYAYMKNRDPHVADGAARARARSPSPCPPSNTRGQFSGKIEYVTSTLDVFIPAHLISEGRGFSSGQELTFETMQKIHAAAGTSDCGAAEGGFTQRLSPRDFKAIDLFGARSPQNFRDLRWQSSTQSSGTQGVVARGLRMKDSLPWTREELDKLKLALEAEGISVLEDCKKSVIVDV